MTDSNTWRHPKERDELVDRLIRAEKANRVLEAELRARVVAEEKHLAGHPDQAALLERIRELEGIVQRQNELRMSGKRRAS